MSFTKYPAPGVNSYSSVSAFPASAGNGTLALALDTDNLYAYNQNSQMWVAIGGPDLNQVSIGDLDGTTPSVKGAVMVGDVLIMQSASTTRSGLVNTTTQSIAGAKTFTNTTESTTKDTGAIITEGGVGVEKNINAGGAITGSNLSGTNTGNVTLTTVGAVPNANAASLSGQVLNLQPADASNPGVVTTGTQSIAGAKTLTNTTQSTTKDTGALILEGGLGVEKNINAGGTITGSNVIAPMNYLGDWTVVGTSSRFDGRVAGMSEDTSLQSESVGIIANSILLTGDGFSDLDSLVLAWNTGNPSNRVDIFEGGSQVPDDQAAIQLAGALAANTPTLAYGIGLIGDVYRVSGTATLDIGGGPEDWVAGDWVVYDEAGQWQKVNHNNLVTSVNGQDGSVVLAMQNSSMQTKLSGSGQPYTPTAGCIFFIIEMIGGGGGGSGGGTTTSGGDGADGADTTFAKGGGPSLTAGKGLKATASVVGAGGTASVSGTSGTPYSVSGSRGQLGDGQGVLVGLRGVGGIGGISPFGGMGSSGSNSNAVDSAANSGSGGCGGGMTTALAGNCGNGGGSGAYIKAVITDIGQYTYTVGAGGAGGSAGTSGTTGGAGGSGAILITEFFDIA